MPISRCDGFALAAEIALKVSPDVNEMYSFSIIVSFLTADPFAESGKAVHGITSIP